ncbi:MAG TPA: serine hydrolase [Candidatus Marinimicrobia bacterium]|jgi:CubicO group peptidase (beta-lactamase class C family)|nr:serine hydrolase [Candidatus Neomarinimicrobiota bacterium]MDP7336913.1 serine hydrolase [Candidatus Neomarinimicrobiota bacterium]HJL84875.1 serine hydrolase [Candidatus Neomarinimicrobiota bacterium]|tara:strand:- start:618 stop:2534 length:1917 start_codon:yes stop_codon:yes gene_type:complete
MKKPLFILLIIPFLFCGCSDSSASTQSDTSEGKVDDKPPTTLSELSERIRILVEKNNNVGIVASLVDSNSVFWAEGFGYADRGAKVEATADMLFRAGSISKSITSLLAMSFVEDSLLDLNSTLREIAPEVEFNNNWESKVPIRLVHLLEHTTGWDDIQFSEYRDFGPNVTISEGLADNPQSRTSRWPPGLYPSYANSGPAVMGYILEQIANSSFNTLATKRIFLPIGASTATFQQTDDVKARVVKSYTAKGEVADFVRIWATSSGSLCITARELGLLTQLFIRRGEMNGVRIVRTETIERMEKPISSLAAQEGLDFGYGLGNYAFYSNDILFHGHNGGIDGFGASYGYQKDKGVGYAVLINEGSNESRKVLDLLTGYIKQLNFVEPELRTHTQAPSKEIGGYYRLFTPRIELLRIATDHLNIIYLREEDGSLFITEGFFSNAIEYSAAGNGQYVKKGRSEPEIITYTGPKGSKEITTGFNSTYRKVSPFNVFGRMVFLFLVALAILIVIILDLILWIGYAFGKFRGRCIWYVWGWLDASISVLAIAIVCFIVGGSSDALANLGTPSFFSRSIQYGTVAFVFFSGITLFKAKISIKSPLWIRWYAGITSGLFLLFSAYLASYGWIGVTVWAYKPAIVGY